MGSKKQGKKTAKAATKRTKKAAETKVARKRAEQPTTGQSGPPLDLPKAKLNDKEQKVVTFLSGDVNPIAINALATNCFPDVAAGQANSWVRNSLRRLVRGQWVEKAGKGTYRFAETARSRWEGTEAPAAEPAPEQAAAQPA